MEAFTTGRVSAAARKAWTEMRGESQVVSFTQCSDGYQMTGWESQIDMARAMGRGAASGNGRAPHRFDLFKTASERQPAPTPARLAPRW